jgi:LPS sulfotransferase NodH
VAVAFLDRPRVVLTARLAPSRAYLASRGGHGDAVRRFVIVTTGRTGSELLVSLLNSHPQIACDGELLHDKHRWPDRLVAGRVERAHRRGKLAYGFKVQPTQIHDVQDLEAPVTWVRSMYAKGWRVIHLRRENRLEQAISVVRRETMQGHFRQGQGGRFEPVALDPYVLMGSMCLIGHSEQRIEELLMGVDHYRISYEGNLLQPADQEATVAHICRMLDLEPQATTTDFVRVTPTSMRESVTNYDEIATVIRQNSFARYLPD